MEQVHRRCAEHCHREGVYKSFQVTLEHFAEKYEKKIHFFIYNSAQFTEIDRFASDSSTNVTIINVQAFNKSADANKNWKVANAGMEKIAQLFEVPVETLMDDYNLFRRQGQGEQVKTIRLNLGLTQKAYAEMLDISLAGLKQWEQEHKQNSRSTWEQYFREV